MDRYAIFVDAGYVWAGGIDTVFPAADNEDSLNRASVALNHKLFIQLLKDYGAQVVPNRELLRVYWYDAAPDRRPTDEHVKISMLPETKLRIGHLTAHGVQKNVDAMLLLDLNALARQNSIQTALIVGGDGDFLEGVTTAQNLGVKVLLLGIGGEMNSVSPELKMEADDFHLLELRDLTPCFSRRGAIPAQRQWTTLPPLPSGSSELASPYISYAKALDPDDVYQAGRRFAARFCADASIKELRDAKESQPKVPEDVHFRLLRHTLEYFEIPRGDRLNRESVSEMRRGFWDGVGEFMAEQPRA